MKRQDYLYRTQKQAIIWRFFKCCEEVLSGGQIYEVTILQTFFLIMNILAKGSLFIFYKVLYRFQCYIYVRNT